jgi:hypothetical protein
MPPIVIKPLRAEDAQHVCSVNEERRQNSSPLNAQWKSARNADVKKSVLKLWMNMKSGHIGIRTSNAAIICSSQSPRRYA